MEVVSKKIYVVQTVKGVMIAAYDRRAEAEELKSWMADAGTIVTVKETDLFPISHMEKRRELEARR